MVIIASEAQKAQDQKPGGIVKFHPILRRSDPQIIGNRCDVPCGWFSAREWRKRFRRQTIKGAKPVGVMATEAHHNLYFYTYDQTKPYQPRPTTEALGTYCRLFIRHANPEMYIWVSEDWKTCHGRITAGHVKQHLAGVQVYGVRGWRKSYWCAFDLDLHKGKDKFEDPEAFLEKTRRLLAYCQSDGWHYALKERDAAGIHLIHVGPLENIATKRRRLLNTLAELDHQHPELGFGKVEVYPHKAKGFRLPLAAGRTIYLDRPLPLLPSGGQDVVSYVGWLEDSNREHAEPALVLSYLKERLVKVGPASVLIQGNSANAELLAAPSGAAKTKPQSKKTPIPKLGPMKNRLGHFFALLRRGQLPDGSLDGACLEYMRIVFAAARLDGLELAEALGIVERELQKVERTEFSVRLTDNWAEVQRMLRREGAKAWEANGNQPDPKTSWRKLLAVIHHWRSNGVDPYDLDSFYLRGEREKRNTEAIIMGSKFALSQQHKFLFMDLLKVKETEVESIVFHILNHFRRPQEFHADWLPGLLKDFKVKLGMKQKRQKILTGLTDLGYLTMLADYWAKKRARAYGLGPKALEMGFQTTQQDFHRSSRTKRKRDFQPGQHTEWIVS